jgi:small subunit ribosomal protein S15
MISKDDKAKAMKKVARKEGDVGSPEVQASIFTERIKELTEHMKEHKHDYMAKRGLTQLVGKRKKALAYLKEKDFEAYKATVAKLGLRK